MQNLRVALAGNPNSGKTTIFNALTGAHQQTGNWPGVTVEKKEGNFTYKGKKLNVVDLPGTYGLAAHSIDEKIARDFILKESPDVVVVIVDATNIERNMYLVVQILEMGRRVIIDMNMMDMAEEKGIQINGQELEEVLNSKVIFTVGTKGKGIQELKDAILEESTKETPEPLKISYGRDIETHIEKIKEDLKEISIYNLPPRWLALKLIEDDEEIQDLIQNKISENTKKSIEETKGYISRVLNYKDIETLFAEKIYGFIHGLAKECIKRRPKIKERIDTTDIIDRIVTNKFWGIPIFLLMMWATFQIVFTLGNPIADWIDTFFGWLGNITASGLTHIGASAWIISLLRDGIISGVGSVIVFLPNILLLFLAIALLEDSGYMARAAFVMDRIMHKMGLHGKSFIPMIIGFGCNVPAIMATRTLESRKDRILTILVNPLMSCSARLPIYILFAGVFFKGHQGLVVFSLYLMGIVLAVLVARLFKWIFFKEEVAPLIMELPPYRMPSLKGVWIHTWNRGSLFLKKAGTIIFLGVVLIWLLASLPKGVEYGSKASYIGRFGSAIAPIFKPAGFSSYQASVALIFGIVAKEIVVGTLGTLYGGESALPTALQHSFTPLSAYAFMVMSLLYIPCIASIAVIKRETNWKWTSLAVGYSLALGWTMATLIYQIGRLFTG